MAKVKDWAQKQRDEKRGLEGRKTTLVGGTISGTITGRSIMYEDMERGAYEATLTKDKMRRATEAMVEQARRAAEDRAYRDAAASQGWEVVTASETYETEWKQREIEFCRVMAKEALDRGNFAEFDLWVGKMASIHAGPRKPENKIKPVVHKAGHFPTQWMEEAIDRAEQSPVCVTLSVERKGIMVVAIEGDDKYASHVITWEAMEKSQVNPLPLAIDDVERKLGVLQKIKQAAA